MSTIASSYEANTSEASSMASTQWTFLAHQVAERFGLDTGRSPTLTRVIEQGVRFIVVDRSAEQLVFDASALIRGFVAVGLSDSGKFSFENTAIWFVDWLTALFGQSVLGEIASQGLTTPDVEVGYALEHKFEITLSLSIQSLLQPAQQCASITIGRRSFEARHFFAALAVRGKFAAKLQSLNLKVTEEDVSQFVRKLVDHILKVPDKGETPEKWEQALRYLRGLSSSSQTVPKFDRDIADASGPDLLDTSVDVQALSRLICLQNISPLAIAILGGWGSGKSTLMERIELEVARITNVETRRRQIYDDGPREPGFLSRIVQIRFNAWQFVDSNLWASLTVEFFDQLRAGGWRRASSARHAELVETVANHVQALSADAATRRDERAAGENALMYAKRARDQARRSVDQAATTVVRHAAVEAIESVVEAQKDNLSSLGMEVSGTDLGAALDAILKVSRGATSVVGCAKAVEQLLWNSRPTRKLILAISLSATVIAAAAYLICLIWFHGAWSAELASAFVALGALGAVATAARPAIALVFTVARKGAEIAQQATSAQNDAVKVLLQREVELRKAAAEAVTLRAAELHSAEALSGYNDPTGALGSPRLLRYLLQDDPNTKALAKETGIIARARSLFQAVDDVVRHELDNQLPGKRLDGDVPERIVLYIDDLDRCTEEQVYAVLQAIHLLLAFELFVVVIGMDLRWVQDALGYCSTGRHTDDHNNEQRDRRAVQYLEKIIQVPFWLQPLESRSASAASGTYSGYVESLAGVVSKSDIPDIIVEPRTIFRAKPDGSLQLDIDDPGHAKEKPSEFAEIDNELATLVLDDAEVRFLASKEIGAIAANTPRGVKRMINIYRLVRAHLAESSDQRAPEFPEYPLVALAVAVQTSQTGEVANALYRGLEAMKGAESLTQAVFWDPAYDDGPDAATRSIRTAIRLCPPLKEALLAVAGTRANSLMAGDLLRVTRVARRYSFHAP